jgi:hypothetical protein
MLEASALMLAVSLASFAAAGIILAAYLRREKR